MTFAEKLSKLIHDSGYSRAEVSRQIGRDTLDPALGRWLKRIGPSRPKAAKPGLRKDGRLSRVGKRESHPTPHDIVALSGLFDVDIRWLIDDRLEWNDKLPADTTILADIRQLSERVQLDMLKWHASGMPPYEAKPAPQAGSTSNPKEKPPVDPPQKGKGETKRGRSASR